MEPVVHRPGEGERLQVGPSTLLIHATSEEIGAIASKYDFKPA